MSLERIAMFVTTVTLTFALCSLGGFAATTELEVWWQGTPDEAAARKLVETFQELHPDIQVNLTVTGYMSGGGGLDRLKTAIVSGTAPDVVYLGTHILPELYLSNMIIPLDEVMKREELDAINYLAPPRQMVTLNNRVLGLQFRTDARGLYFNRDVFIEAGFNDVTGPQYLEDLDSYAQKLTLFDNSGSPTRLGFIPAGNNFLNELGWLWVFGGSPYDPEINRPTLTGDSAHLRAVEWIGSYADRYGASAVGGLPKFNDGTLAMIVQSTTVLQQIPTQAPDLRWWVSHIPYPREGRKTTYSAGPGGAIPYGTENIESATTFIRYLSKKETQMEWYKMTQQVPAREDAMRELIQTGVISDPREIAMLEVIPNGFAAYPLVSSVVAGQFRTLLDQFRNKAITAVQVLEETERATIPAYIELFGE